MCCRRCSSAANAGSCAGTFCAHSKPAAARADARRATSNGTLQMQAIRSMRVADTPPSPQPRGHALVVRDLGKSYGQGAGIKEVLRGIELRVEPGELVCIVGPSGAGKTTLLRCLAGLLPASSGTVTLGERVVTEPP